MPSRPPPTTNDPSSSGFQARSSSASGQQTHSVDSRSSILDKEGVTNMCEVLDHVACGTGMWHRINASRRRHSDGVLFNFHSLPFCHHHRVLDFAIQGKPPSRIVGCPLAASPAVSRPRTPYRCRHERPSFLRNVRQQSPQIGSHCNSSGSCLF